MKRLLLAGGGHAHVGVLQALAARPLQDTEVTLVTPAARQIYSGMLPGWIAGHYTLDQCVIPLAPAAARAGVRLLLGHVTGLDLAARQARVQPADGNPDITALPFDLLSIDTGPVTNPGPIAGAAAAAVPLRPLEHFVAQWPALQRQLTARPPGTGTSTLSVIGGGAGGVELALAAAWRAHSEAAPLRVQLVAGRSGVLPTASASTRQHLRAALAARAVAVIEDDAAAVAPGIVQLAGGAERPSDTTLLVTGAAAAAWPGASGLAVDERGFIAINEHLQSVSHPEVFAAGDCASMRAHPRPRSCFYAVLSVQVLADNLLRALAGQPLRGYVPQRRALYLLATGPRHAVASWGPLTLAGNWVGRWKDRIDRRVIARHAGGG
ncbi:MAG: FAD-dependent oxidoreductase [Betaproteobacteria bacterium]